MRKIIPDRGAANRPPFVVVGDETIGVVVLEADRRRHWIGPGEARRIAEALLQADPEAREGLLAPRFNALVRREACAEVAREIDLGDALKLGRSEMLAGGRKRDAMLADAMEAVIAAVFLDAGFEAARAVVLRLWGERVAGAPEDARDAKTALQEWAQARGLQPPSYDQVGREGPDHAPRFVIEARLSTGEVAQGEGASKRMAEHRAAAALLERVGG